MLADNEYYRINSYYWGGMIYIALQEEEEKILCQIKGSKAKPKWIKKAHLAKEQKQSN